MAVLVLAGLVLATCALPADEVVPTAVSTPTPAVPLMTTVPPSTATLAPTTTMTTVLVGESGASGIGDDLYPLLGNGGYDVARYELDLEVDMSTGALAGTARVIASARQNLASFNLDLVGLEVTDVAVDGATVEFARAGRELTVLLPEAIAVGTSFETVVTYAGVPAPVSASVPFGSGWQKAGDLVYVLDQPDGASSWFPVNDHPLDPATFLIALDVPAGYETVTSGVAVSGLDDPDEADVWEIPEETSPYLVALAVGEFERLVQDPAGDIDLVVWHPPDLAPALLRPFAAHADMLAFFSDRFGEYPFDRYGALVIDDPELAAALETQTLSTFGLPALGEEVVAHELVHQWFGDSVRVASWKDIWLNEGFATFGQWLWAEETEGPTAYDLQVAQAYGLMSGAVFATPNSTGADEARRRFPPPASPVAEDLFNPSVYLRGGLALVGLRDEVGDEATRELMRAWFDQSRGNAVDTAQFQTLTGQLLGPEALAVLNSHLRDDLPPAMPVRGLAPPA
ncbi:MAG: M1 family metallopeptidase [Acidimicrobiia bacterium]